MFDLGNVATLDFFFFIGEAVFFPVIFVHHFNAYDFIEEFSIANDLQVTSVEV